MKAVTIVGIILIVLGVLGFIFGGINFTSEKKVADIGPVEIEKESEETIPIGPVASGVAVAAGIVMVIAGTRKGH